MREAAGCVHLSARAQIARWSPRHVKDTNTGHVARMLTVTIQFAVVKDILVFTVVEEIPAGLWRNNNPAWLSADARLRRQVRVSSQNKGICPGRHVFPCFICERTTP